MGQSLAINDVLGVKASPDQVREANLRSLGEERALHKDAKTLAVIDDEIAKVKGGTVGERSIGDAVNDELIGSPAAPAAAKPIASPAPKATPVADAPASDQTRLEMADQFKAKLQEKQTGMEEAAKTVGSGMLSTIAGGYRGLYKTVEALRNGQSLDAAVEHGAKAVNETVEKHTYQPKTESGKKAVEVLASDANPLNWIPHAGEAIADLGADIGTMSPAVSTAIKTGAAVANVGAIAKGWQAMRAPPKAKVAAAIAPEVMDKAGNLVKRAVSEAQSHGYVVTPRQASPQSILANTYEGAAGTAKMEKLASVKNQANTNRIIATEDLGLKPNEAITPEVLQRQLKEQGAAYQAVKDSDIELKANDAYRKAVSELHGDIKEALPGIVKTAEVDDLAAALNVEKMTPKTAIMTVKVLRADATKNIKAGYQNPEKEALGFAQRKAANAIDDLIESNLASAGKKDLSDAYRTARVKIAKIHDIDAALNEQTGNIDANVLAKMLDKGRPLSGGMRKVGEFAKAFKGSARNVDTMREAANFSMADLIVGAVAGQLTPVGMVAVGARPAARSIALSKIGQKAIAPNMSKLSEVKP